MKIVQATFISSIKLDRIRFLKNHILDAGISLKITPVSNRRPFAIFKLLNSTPRDDLLMTHEWLMIPIMLGLLNLLKNTRYILIMNGDLWITWRDLHWSLIRINLYRSLLKFAIMHSQYTICNSQYLYRRLCEEIPAAKKKSHPIYNGIDIQPESTPEKFQYKDDVSNFLTLTNFEYPRKLMGLDLLFKALQCDKLQNSHLYILGKVETKRGEQQAEKLIQRMENSYPTVKWTLFLNAKVSTFFCPERSVFVYSSGIGGDSLPRAILEAQLAGMPTVVVDTNGCAEAVIKDISALVVPPDETDLKDAMLEISSQNFDRDFMQQKAIENVQLRFSWDRMAQAYAALIIKN